MPPEFSFRLHTDERGVTLVELLLVLMILGSIAGIALVGSTALQNAAVEACEDSNRRLGVIADTAVDAGVTGDLFVQAPEDCGDPVPPPLPVALVVAIPAATAILAVSRARLRRLQ